MIVFSRHNYDVGTNDQFKIKLTPETEGPVYTQSPPTAILLREGILVDLAIMQYFEIMTTNDCPTPKIRALFLRNANHPENFDY